MRTEGKRTGRGGVSFWAALLSACLFFALPAAVCFAEGGTETIVSEAMPWFLSAGEAAKAAMKQEKESDGEEKTAAWVRKSWEDEGYPDKRPDSLLCRLYRNGVATARTVTLRSGNGWQAMIAGLDRFDSAGAEIKWTWKEITLLDSGYYVQGDPRSEPHSETIGGKVYTGVLTTLSNRLTVTELTIEKIWLNDRKGDRPKELAVKLSRENAAGETYAGEEGTRTLTLSAADQDAADMSRWRKTIRNLPVVEGDVWHISEAVPGGYRAEGQPGSAKTSSGAIAPGVLTLRNRKEEKEKPARKPEAGGGSGGSRRTDPVKLENSPAPEEMLPDEIPNVGAPKRTLVILFISGFALAAAGVTLARAGRRTKMKRTGYGITAVGVTLALLAIPLAARYLAESGGAESALESARAELSETLLQSPETPENVAMRDGENRMAAEAPEGAATETEYENGAEEAQAAGSADTADAVKPGDVNTGAELQPLDDEPPADGKPDAAETVALDEESAADAGPGSINEPETQTEPEMGKDERLQVLAGRVSEAALRRMLRAARPDSARVTPTPEKETILAEDPGVGTQDAASSLHPEQAAGPATQDETEAENRANVADAPQDGRQGESQPEKQAHWTPETELRVLWVNGKRYAGFASAPSLALSWPVQADWTGESLAVSPGVFFGKPYGDRFILIGHNYPSHFGTIEDLKPGDEVLFRDFSGNEFTYEVIRMDYLNPQDMDALLGDPAALTLVTCARDGNRRVAVRCKRKE